MKILKGGFRHRTYLLVIVAGGLVAMSSLTMRSRARTTNINVVNNSSLEVRHLYFSAPNSENWSGDQLNGSTITTGNSFSLSNPPCEQGSIKLIAEDQNGCFLYQTVSCVSDTSWTITNDASPDCGS